MASGFLIDQGDWLDFATAHGREELMNVSVTRITGMALEEVVKLIGGIEFSRAGKEVMRWPSKNANLLT